MSALDDLIQRTLRGDRGYCEPPVMKQEVKLVEVGVFAWERARKVAYDVHRSAPRQKQAYLHDNGKNIIVTCDDGVVLSVSVAPNGQALIVAADGLLEVHR